VATVSTYLNFAGQTEAAFEFYKSVFGTEYASPIMRHRDVPLQPGQPGPSEELANMVINVQLPILGGHLLMGSDATPEMGFTLNQGNNVYICLHPDTRTEADAIFAKLSEGGEVEMAPAEQFWGDYFGSWKDKFGICWMINTSAKA
jgi:PhnB protein